jgi:hypothetical protein
MSFIWTESILDNQLFWEFSKSNPDEKAIRSLIEQGADINSIDCKGDSVLMDAISNVQDGLDLKFIQLIIDLGADLDYAEEGFNCLFDASLTQRPELVELLLKAGANPNCVASESAESLLDWVEFDKFYEETEDCGGAEPMTKIVELLKKYGAKSISEIIVDKPEKFLTVFSGYIPTGLHTLNGYLEIENIPNVDNDTIISFKEWLAENPDKWGEYDYYDGAKISNPPDFELLKKHNDKGMHLSKVVRKLLDKEIEVKYLFINIDDFKNKNVRNVEHVKID